MMKTTILVCVSLIPVFMGLMSCSNNPSTNVEIPVVHVSGDAELRALDLSDIFVVEKLMALETTTSNLVPAIGVSLIPAGKYLLIREGNKRIHQYTMDGKFIRFLATGGNGPNEFSGISAYATDTVNQIFYYSHNGDKAHLAAIDMETGNPLERIAFPLNDLGAEVEPTNMSSLILVDDHTLACVPRATENLVYSLFFMNIKGDFLWGIPRDTSHLNYSAQQVGSEIHFRKDYLETYSDTIYSVAKNGVWNPDRIINLNLRDLKANEKLSWRIIHEGPTTLIVDVSIPITVAVGNMTQTTYPTIHYFVDKPSGALFTFSKYRIDYLGGIEVSLFMPVNDNQAAVKIDAFDFRQHAQEVLKQDDLDPEVRTRLEDLMSKVTDDSNPIVLVGRLK